jgi:hypothetical protein
LKSDGKKFDFVTLCETFTRAELLSKCGRMRQGGWRASMFLDVNQKILYTTELGHQDVLSDNA